MLAGPPRISPYFADLDPSASGGVYVRSAPDAFTVTWCALAVFDSTRRATFQTSLLQRHHRSRRRELQAVGAVEKYSLPPRPGRHQPAVRLVISTLLLQTP